MPDLIRHPPAFSSTATSYASAAPNLQNNDGVLEKLLIIILEGGKDPRA
jgi:hypothetical protein